MDLNHVAVFVKVVGEGGFSAAARALRLPKSSVSRAVALLEDELKVRLLQRSTRKVHLTEAGTAFFERASRGLAGVDEAAVAVTEMQTALRGNIRITAPVDAGVWLLAGPIARFSRLHPGVTVEVVLTSRVVDLVDEGFDLALRAAPLRDSTLVARKAAAVTVALYAAPEYLARRGVPTEVADLARHDCVIFRPTRGRTTWNLRGPNGLESIEVGGPIGVDDFSFVRRVVLAGAGIGLLPSFLCQTAITTQRLQRVLPDHALESTPANLVYPSARYLPQRVAALRDYLIAALAEGALSGDTTVEADEAT